ncbi:MAG: hypothetical protein IJ692_05995 [Alloprevotella sp.]|nr:hypothetical protein [Bacteroidales bacterium]MBR1652925.1 hypothetical protein [Alloprevotella sp.]
MVVFCALGLSAQRTEVNAVSEGGTWWSYAGDAPLQVYRTMPPETCDFAILLPAQKYGLSGHTLRGIRFYVPASSAVQDFSVWVSTSLPSTVSKASVAYKALDASTLVPGELNEVLFDEPYTLTRNVYLGYSFTATDASVRNVGCVAPTGITDACWTRFSVFSGGSWGTTFAQEFSLALYALFGEEFPAGAKVEKTGYVTTLAGQPHAVDMTLQNCSPEGIRSIDYVVTAEDGTASAPLHMDFSTYSTAMSSRDVTLPLPATSELGFHKPTVAITHVNGRQNAVPAANATGTVDQLVVSRSAEVKRVVEEEFTGLWCGWCPQGMVGMQLAEQQFGDRYIGIAVHQNDVMAGSSSGGYSTILSKVSGLPACYINRNGLKPGTYYGLTENTPFGLADVIRDELDRIAEADISLQAEWTDEKKTKVRATSSTRFYLDNADAPYALAYVLLSDSLRNSSWVQTNYFSGYNYVQDDPNLRPYVDAPEKLTGLTFNHVAIASSGVTNGITGSVAAPLVADEDRTHEVTLSVPTSNTLVQDKQNLRVVALLINRTRGNIVNAAVTTIAEPTGISDVDVSQAARHSSTIYDLQGRRVRSALPLGSSKNGQIPKGLYIVGGRKVLR